MPPATPVDLAAGRYALRAEAKFKSDQLDEALLDVNQALALALGDPLALRIRAGIYEKQERLDDAIAAKSVDWMSAVAVPLPVTIIAGVLGMPHSDLADLTRGERLVREHPPDGAAGHLVELAALHIADAEYYAGLDESFNHYDALLYEMVKPLEPAGAMPPEAGTPKATVGMRWPPSVELLAAPGPSTPSTAPFQKRSLPGGLWTAWA